MRFELVSKVREVKEVYSIQEINELIEKDWILLKIVPSKDGYIYILGRLEI